MNTVKEAMDRLIGGQIPVAVIGGVVTAVRPAEDTCDVQPDSDDALVYDVTLLNGIYPAVGAQVLIGLVENRLVDTFLISADKVTHFRFTTKQESLLTLQRDFIDELVKLTVTTPAGPSGPPINAAGLLAIKARFDNLLLP